MPWTIEKRSGKYYVINEETNEAVDNGYSDKEQAAAHLGALYANVPEAHRKLSSVDWNTDKAKKACCSDCAKTGGSCKDNDSHLLSTITNTIKTLSQGASHA